MGVWRTAARETPTGPTKRRRRWGVTSRSSPEVEDGTAGAEAVGLVLELVHVLPAVVDPYTCPPRTPPPASRAVKAWGQWSRPLRLVLLLCENCPSRGVRPNSP